MNTLKAFTTALHSVFYILVGKFPSMKILLLYLGWMIVAMFEIWQEMPDTEIPGPACSTETMQALKNFFSRAWFRRTWIIQEIGASRDAVILCGEQEIPWASLRSAASQIEEVTNLHPGRSPYLDSGFQALNFLSGNLDIGIDDIRAAEIKRSLLYLMTSFSHSEATDPRDKVYGLFGLSNDAQCQTSSQHHLEIDYTKSTVKVYAEVVRYLVESTGCLDVLRACVGTGRVTGLPSWVPDWTGSQTKSLAGIAYWRKPFCVEKANKTKEFVAHFSPDLSIMYVQGFVIGRLSNYGQEFSLPMASIIDEELAWKLIQGLMRYFIGPLFLTITRSWGVHYLLRFIAYCDPAGLGFCL